MTSRNIAIGVIAVGALLALISLGADLIGLSDDPGFQVGPRQWSGILSGLVIVVLGISLLKRSKSS